MSQQTFSSPSASVTDTPPRPSRAMDASISTPSTIKYITAPSTPNVIPPASNQSTPATSNSVKINSTVPPRANSTPINTFPPLRQQTAYSRAVSTPIEPSISPAAFPIPIHCDLRPTPFDMDNAYSNYWRGQCLHNILTMYHENEQYSGGVPEGGGMSELSDEQRENESVVWYDYEGICFALVCIPPLWISLLLPRILHGRERHCDIEMCSCLQGLLTRVLRADDHGRITITTSSVISTSASAAAMAKVT
ncbi:MAG: hypothetical protein Q9166_006881 [cf. Caloplaca sp. 2 TL-2023]